MLPAQSSAALFVRTRKEYLYVRRLGKRSGARLLTPIRKCVFRRTFDSQIAK
ncbi:UNVERIFIED_CONTAM: hypothetical protein N8J90_18910 [Halobacillus marinus]